MDTETLQQRIDNCGNNRDRIAIAQAYLSGKPILDRVAAEAWLTRIIDSGDPVYAPRAMGLLAREILGKKTIFPESEISVLKRELAAARGKEKKELEELLKIHEKTGKQV